MNKLLVPRVLNIRQIGGKTSNFNENVSITRISKTLRF